MFAIRERSSGSVVSWVRYLPISIGYSYSLSFLLTSVQLLHKLSIRGINGPEKLLKVIKVSNSMLFLSLLTQKPFATIAEPSCGPDSLFPETVQPNVCQNIYPPYPQHAISPFSLVPWPRLET